MKIGGIDGTPEEIKNLIENNGLNLLDYIEQPKKPLNKIWVIIPSIIITILFLSLMVSHSLPNDTKNIIFTIAFAMTIWLSVSIQLKFENAWASGIAFIGTTLLLLISLGVLTPSDIPKYYEAFKQDN